MGISNKFLMFLLAIVILVTVVGTLYSINTLNKYALITGYQTEGNVTLNITERVEINVTQAACNFGSGYVTPPAAFAVLSPNTVGYNSYCNSEDDRLDNWTNTTAYDPACLEIRNDGNREVVVNVSSGKDVANMIGGTNPNVTAWSIEKEVGACYTGTKQAYPGVEMDTNNYTMCSCLHPEENFDEIYIGCELTIPDNTFGYKNDTWTFYATAANNETDCVPT